MLNSPRTYASRSLRERATEKTHPTPLEKFSRDIFAKAFTYSAAHPTS
jgi:hypothetical protein